MCEERELHAVVRDGIAQAEVFAGRSLAALLCAQRNEVGAIIAMLTERTRHLPTPARFAATDANQEACSRLLRTVVGSGTGHRIEELHADLAERFAHFTAAAIASNGDRSFDRLSRRHQEMGGKLHELLKLRPWLGAADLRSRPEA